MAYKPRASASCEKFLDRHVCKCLTFGELSEIICISYSSHLPAGTGQKAQGWGEVCGMGGAGAWGWVGLMG